MRNLKRALSLALATVMTLGLMVVGTGAVGYTDVTSEDNQEAIEVLQAVGIMTGVTDDEFNPDGLVTRNQMAVIMSNLLNLDYDYYRGINPFTDVPAWAAPYVAACVAEGVTAGIGGGLYGGENNVTAAQAALMIMKALGYFQYQGDFNPDWQVATVRQASYIGLFNGVDANAEQALTRSQVAQLVLNGLEATMVTFTGTVGTELTLPDGTTYSAGYVSEYSYRTGTAEKYNTLGYGKTDISDQGQYYIQLGEELYEGDLELRNSSDDFGRPARYWEYDGDAIGTYVKDELLREEYTEKVTGEELYDLLGKTIIDEYDLVVYIDGVSDDSLNANVFGKSKLARTYDLGVGATGNGVLTQVFVDPNAGKDGQITISIINTYLAKANSDYNESRENASFTVYGLVENTAGGNKALVKNTADSDSVTAGKQAYTRTLAIEAEDFPEAEAVLEDEIYLVTVADNAIQTIARPETVEETELDTFKKTSWVSTAGDVYDYANTALYNEEVLDQYSDSNMKETLYNLFLDPYGNLIGIEIAEQADNYVFITGYDRGTSALATKNADAFAIFVDGIADEIVVDTTTGGAANWSTDGEATHNTWYTYTEKNGVYTLSAIDDASDGVAAGEKVAQYHNNVDTTIDKAHIALGAGAGKTAYGNADTVYLVADLKQITHDGDPRVIINDVDSVYVGQKNVSLDTWDRSIINGKYAGMSSYQDANHMSSGTYTLYKTTNGIAIATVVVGEDNAVTDNYAFVISEVNKEYYDKANDEWTWYCDAIVNGEKVTLSEVGSTWKALQNVDVNTWYKVSYDANGYVKEMDLIANSASDPADVDHSTYWATTGKFINSLTSFNALASDPKLDVLLVADDVEDDDLVLSGYTLHNDKSLASNTGIDLMEDCKAVLVEMVDGSWEYTYYDNSSNNVRAMINALRENPLTGTNAMLYAVMNNGLASTVIIVDTHNYTSTEGPAPSDKITFTSTDAANGFAAPQWYSADPTAVLSDADVQKMLTDAGAENITKGNGNAWNFTYNGVNYANTSITPVRAYLIRLTDGTSATFTPELYMAGGDMKTVTLHGTAAHLFSTTNTMTPNGGFAIGGAGANTAWTVTAASISNGTHDVTFTLTAPATLTADTTVTITIG